MASPVPLFFSRRFPVRQFVNLRTCVRQNVVLHVSFEVAVFKSMLRARFHHPHQALESLGDWSSSDPDSPFRHNKYNLGTHGKVLQFQRKRNLIRAGKHTHADAVRATLFFCRWTAPSSWPTRMSSPNMVASGTFTRPLPRSVRDLPHATWSTKFPGVALKTSVGQCTPEVYPDQGTYIVPGVTTPASLVQCLEELCAQTAALLADTHNCTAPPS